MTLTVGYFTNRRNPRFQWFADSLWHQWVALQPNMKLVIVDFYADQFYEDVDRRERVASIFSRFKDVGVTVVHTAPQGNPWQGEHRLTTRNYFAASNARNTAICLAPDGYIVFVDDLSVLLPGWLDQVLEAMEGGWIACGAYSKVKELVVEDGRVKSFLGLNPPFTGSVGQVIKAAREGFPAGVDSRLQSAPDIDNPFNATGSWMFGCSCAIPVEALLEVNGFDLDADHVSGEDYICGLMMHQHGYKFKYCRRMFTLESEEAHGEDEPFLRIIKGKGKDDASWRLLNMVNSGKRSVAPNYYGSEGLRGQRERILAGEPFPVISVPDRDWYDGQPLKEM